MSEVQMWKKMLVTYGWEENTCIRI